MSERKPWSKEANDRAKLTLGYLGDCCSRCFNKGERVEITVTEAGDTFREFGLRLCSSCASTGRSKGYGRQVRDEKPDDSKLGVVRRYRSMLDGIRTAAGVKVAFESTVLDPDVTPQMTEIILRLAEIRRLEIGLM